MRLELFDEDGKKKRLDVKADHFALQIPEDAAPVFLQATMDESSPIKIIMNGNGGPPREIPVRGLGLKSGLRTMRKAFSYRRTAKTIHVRQHYMTRPMYFRRNATNPHTSL